ncbi:MAG: hypothetical protein J6S69_01520 [Proteobacteria bacterium]|nr:hypothetical protein [Pseudomonadota bacterium]
MKPTDSKNKPNSRKKTDSRNKLEVWQNTEVPVSSAGELPDLPVVSRLRRVVDMSAIQPVRAKKQETGKPAVRKPHGTSRKQASNDEVVQTTRKTSGETPHGKGGRRYRQDKSASKHVQSNDAVETVENEHRPVEPSVVHDIHQADGDSKLPVRNATELAPAQSDVASDKGVEEGRKKGSKKTFLSHKKRKIQAYMEDESSVKPEPVPALSQEEHFAMTETEPKPQLDDSFNALNIAEAPARKIRTSKAIKPKLHLSEKHAIARKERASTAPRLLSRQHGHQAEARRLEVTGLVDNIMESLMLESWRARQWMMNVASLSDDLENMLQRCMPIVQARFVNNICIDGGRLEATVVEQVASVGLRQFTPGQWRAVVNGLSDRAIFTTSLLNDELPEGILEVFKQASLSLFPTKLKEFEFFCDCEAEQMPCEHVCALLLSFAQALEKDPFHILALRGMTRDNLLAFLRDARSDQVVDEKTRHRINYELPAQNVDFESFCTPKGDFEELKFHIAYEANTLVRRLGNPSVWHGPMSLEAAVMPMIELASKEAENLGLGEQYVIPLSHQERPIQTSQGGSRAPKSSGRAPKFKMPDMSFVLTALTPEILETVPDDPVTTAEDIIRWLKTRGASDIRTLARRTRLHKPTIEAFLNAFCDAGLTIKEGDEEKVRFLAVF